MNIPEFSVKRSVTTAMIYIGIAIAGIIALRTLPLDLMPDITIPAISVITVYSGASPEDIEKKVTEPVEETLSTIPDVKTVTSRSEENVSSVTLEFEWGTDLTEASNDIRDKLDMLSMVLPEDVESPILFKFDMSQMPVIFLGFTAPEGYPNFYETVEEKIKKPLERTPGVGLVAMRGGQEKQVRIDVDYEKLKIYNLTLDMIINSLGAANLSMPGGTVEYGQKELLVRVPGEFETIDEIRELVLLSQGSRIIRLKDVANVYMGTKEIENIFKLNGTDAVMIFVQKQSGKNTVQVARDVRKDLEELKKNLPPEIQGGVIMDTSEFITETVKSLTSTVVIGGLLVMIVIGIFLGQLRGSLIISLTLPFSLIFSFIFIWIFGYTINMMTLSALAIAIGMVVDNAIVIFENIFRHHYERHESLKEAAIHAPSEVGTAVVASSLTTIVIFLPLIFLKGMIGALFKEFGITLIVILVSSLFASLTLIPMLSSKLLKPWDQLKNNNNNRKRKTLFSYITEIYESVLKWSLKNKIGIYSISIFLFLSVIFFVSKGYLHTEFFPQEDQGRLTVTVELPISTKVQEAEELSKIIENIINEEVIEQKTVFTNLGASQGFSRMGSKEANNIINLTVIIDAPKKERRPTKELANIIRERLKNEIPNVVNMSVSDIDPFQTMMMGSQGKAIQVEILGDDFNETDKLGLEIMEGMKKIRGLKDLTISREKGKEELLIRIDRVKAANLGLNIYSVAQTIRNLYYGADAGKFRQGGEEYEIFLMIDDKYTLTPFEIENLQFENYMGKKISFKNFAELEFGKGPVAIDHKDRIRYFVIEANRTGDSSLGEIKQDVEKLLAGLYIPRNVNVELAGEFKQQTEANIDMFIAFLIGLILVYMVMASQFESLKSPFIIMFTIPFAVIGVAYGLLLTGHSISVMSLLGMVMLVGIVVNNGIVLIDYTEILRQREIPVYSAIIIAAKRRLRPILMTSFTTIFGIMPLALTKAEGSESWNPIGVAVASGLLVSGLITLVIIPTIYAHMNGLSRKKIIEVEDKEAELEEQYKIID
ncbi:MAG: efflux RND transporter permease subunit [bacterium]|nr:efflux RND transporter permease subunit [bacterium]